MTPRAGILAALDAHPHRLERTIAALLGVGAALGWTLIP